MTEQVNVATLEDPVGPVVDPHVVTPLTPVIAHVGFSAGVAALTGPVTVAVKVIVAPTDAVGAFADTATVGVTATTVLESTPAGVVG